jgi:hypothetical protein
LYQARRLRPLIASISTDLEANHFAETAPVLTMADNWHDIASSLRKLAAYANQAQQPMLRTRVDDDIKN